MLQLIYYVSETPVTDSSPVNTPLGMRYIRAVIFRGGSDPLEWASRHARSDEVFLNTVDEFETKGEG